MNAWSRILAYSTLIGAGWRAALAYRSALVFAALSTALSLAVQLSVWRAVYAGRDGVGSYQPAEMTTYLVAGNLLAVLLANQIDDTLAADIYRGDYVVGMLRPISFLGAHAASAVPQVLIRLLLVTVPILVLAAIAVPLVAPTPEGLRWFLLSAGLAAILGVLLNLIVGLAGFVTTSTWGVRYLKGTVLSFASGQLVPLDLLPEVGRRVLVALPFAAMVHTPVSLLLGRIRGVAALTAVGWQLLWVLLGGLCCALAWRAAGARAEVNGG